MPSPRDAAGDTGTPLWRKIGIKEGHRVRPMGMPAAVRRALAGVPPHEHVEDDADWERLNRHAFIAGHVGPDDELWATNPRDFLTLGVPEEQVVAV